MKIVMLNAATLPVYRDELARLLIEASKQGITAGLPPTFEQQEAENVFHDLRPAISHNELLLWIARDEQGVTGTVLLNLVRSQESSHHAEVSALLVCSRVRRSGVGRLLLRESEIKAQVLRYTMLSSDMQSGTAAEAFYRSQGYRCAQCKTSTDYRRKNEVVYYKQLQP
ncbi:GCN5 family acetyltransferase [Serratia sp. Leaf51]|nr:GCN5 family acetyltransferase [Serratia sp. Leaf51]